MKKCRRYFNQILKENNFLKKKLHSTSQGFLKKKQGSPTDEKHMEHIFKIDAVRKQEKEEIKRRAQQIEERLNKGAQRVYEHKLALSDYLTERREISEHRTQIAKMNRQFVVQEEVSIEGLTMSYLNRKSGLKRSFMRFRIKWKGLIRIKKL